MMPPTSVDRSRPPVPIPCVIPTPMRVRLLVTDCNPVPAAATTPTGPGVMALAKPSAIPLMMAVPASGPMTSRPFSRPISLSAFSSSTVTLSLNRKTCLPFASASRATPAA